MCEDSEIIVGLYIVNIKNNFTSPIRGPKPMTDFFFQDSANPGHPVTLAPRNVIVAQDVWNCAEKYPNVI